jgi:hypothetical protein
MEINIQQTQQFNRLLTNVVDSLLYDNEDTINTIMDTLYYNYNLDFLLQESLYEDESLSKNNNLYLKQDKIILHENLSSDCCICMDKLIKNNNIFSCCGCHSTFHYDCMNEWIKMNNTCPKCRHHIDIIEHKSFEEWIDDNLNL